MRKNLATTAILGLTMLAAPVLAQDKSIPVSPGQGMAQGTDGAFSGYVPAVNRGMVAGSHEVRETTAPQIDPQTGQALPPLSDGKVVTAEKIEGFNQAIEQNFPMTPEMARRYRQISEESERALLEREEPKAKIDTGFITLEPGETPTELTVAPGIASVLGFYDVTGQPWPVSQYVLGQGDTFQVLQLNSAPNNLAMTPLARFGFTNLVVVLEGHSKPVVMRIQVNENAAHYRHDLQIMERGPQAVINTATGEAPAKQAGSPLLVASLAGVDMPPDAVPVNVVGVDARAWKLGDNLIIRSRHALTAPPWTNSMAGPDGVRVYEIPAGPVALFSVNGQNVRADIILP